MLPTKLKWFQPTVLLIHNPDVLAAVEAFRQQQTDTVLDNPNPAEDA
jgi:5-(carboxyamino)imidazole ribonucleotide mutase